MTIDIAVIIVYMLAINVIGMACARVGSINDYFLGSRTIPWPIACFSIVATETSSLTFISIPGLAYISNLGFIQVALGYVLGRVLVAAVLLPRYFAGNMETAYEFLQSRFGLSSRRIMAVVFHVTRLLADSIRLFATAIPLSLLMGFDSYWPAILIVGLTTFVYTLYGGIRSVAITDSIQLGVYLVSAVAGIFVISHILGMPILEVYRSVPEAGRELFSTGMSGGWRGIFGSYNIFSGIIGGAILSFASHGTDHLIVQRILSCRNLAAARKAMIWSGLLVFVQFGLFLVLGLFIYVLLGGKTFDIPDTIMPYFIIHHVPPGIKGLMLAGIFAAAMSTISASINSISSSTVMDILRLPERDMTDRRRLLVSRCISLAWSCVMMGIAFFLQNTKSPLVELGLSIASITYGGMLGIFIQGALFRNFSDRAAIAGVAASIASVLGVFFGCDLFWPWFVPIGFSVSLLVGSALNAVMKR